MAKHEVLVLGAGFGGLTVARELASKRASVHVTVVDKSRFHTFTPLLYEAATAFTEHENLGTPKLLESGVALDIERLVAPWGADFACEEATAHDAAARTVTCKSGKTFRYDSLVVALGAETNYFNVPGLREHAYVLKTIPDADTLRQRVHDVLHMQEMGKRPAVRVVVGGGGATGVEFAAELAMFLRHHVVQGHLKPREYDITVVEASPRLLGMMPNTVSAATLDRLKSLGIRVHLDSTIKEVMMGKVTLAPRACKPNETPDQLLCDFTSEGEKTIETDIVVWCGGIRGSSALETLGFPVDARGKRIEIGDTLEVPNMTGVYAIGDAAVLMNPETKMPVPWLAQAAMDMGRTAAARITARAEKGTEAPKYKFHNFPAVVPLGGKYCAAVVGGKPYVGFLGYLIHQAATLRYFITVLPFGKGLKYWWNGARMYSVND